jgi:hypothetical protein
MALRRHLEEWKRIVAIDDRVHRRDDPRCFAAPDTCVATERRARWPNTSSAAPSAMTARRLIPMPRSCERLRMLQASKEVTDCFPGACASDLVRRAVLRPVADASRSAVPPSRSAPRRGVPRSHRCCGQPLPSRLRWRPTVLAEGWRIVPASGGTGRWTGPTAPPPRRGRSPRSRRASGGGCPKGERAPTPRRHRPQRGDSCGLESPSP